MRKEIFEFGNNKSSNLGKKEKFNKYDFDFQNFDINEKNDSHAAIARQIKEKSKVLDIGCSTGTIGKILTKFKGCRVDGIEYDKDTLKIAKESGAYQNLYHFSINDPTDIEFQNFLEKNQKYDTIVFGDVLEHLYNPWDVLELVSSFLKKNGQIIISLPNVSHLDVIKGLINNNFNYNNVGLLDSTHVRFFTSNSFLDMIKNLAEERKIFFSVELVEKIIASPKYLDDSKIYELFNVDNYLENFLVLQNIFVLTLEKKKENMKFKNILNKEYFKRMNEYYTAILKDRERLELENLQINNKLILEQRRINKLKSEFDKLDKINQETTKKYLEIINSKRWKIINKVFSKIGK